MPRHDVYTLHVYRSRAVRGWQWIVRLEHLPGGESLRFTEPQALMAYLARVLQAADPSKASRDPPAGAEPADTGTHEGGTPEEG
jgi:hypothetical protein